MPLLPTSAALSPSAKHRGSGATSGPRRKGNGRSYKPGDTVRQSGIYEVVHDREHRGAHEVVMVSGDLFPPCDTCRDRVRFKLAHSATYIFFDQDFENSAE